MTRRILAVCRSLLLAGLAACGGKATGGDAEGALPGMDAPTNDLSGVEEPVALKSLELRRFEQSNEVGTRVPGCEYSERQKVYFRSREMVVTTCREREGSVSGARESTELLDADLERIQKGYAELRVVAGAQCDGSANWLSLAVVPLDDSNDLQLLDAEHSGCPLAGVEGETYVEGLGRLYRLLAELQAK